MGHQYSLTRFTALSGLAALFIKDSKRLDRLYPGSPRNMGRKAGVKLLPVLRAPDHKISGGSWVSSNHKCQLRPGCHFLLPILSVKGPQGEERTLHSHVGLCGTSLPSPHSLLRAAHVVSRGCLFVPL